MSRVALVTGGTRGIGEAISVALKDAGYTVVANYAGNDEAASKFSEETGIATYKFDVSDYDACQATVAQIENDVGPVEILVNNAGITRDGTMHRMNFEQWNAVIQTNLTSCFNMCHAVLNGMREREFGRIVNIGSVNGQAGQVRHSRLYQGAGAGRCGQGNYRQRDRARLYRHRHGARGTGKRAREDRGTHPGGPTWRGARNCARRAVPGV